MLPILTDYYYKELFGYDKESIDPWTDKEILLDPITLSEVEIALARLNGSRSPGPDELVAEQCKYAPTVFHEI